MQTINRRTSSKALRPNQDLADKSAEPPRERERERDVENEREKIPSSICAYPIAIIIFHSIAIIATV